MTLSQISVGTDETKLFDSTTKAKRRIIKPTGEDIYVGNTGLTTSDGFLIKQGTEFVIEQPEYKGELYALTASGTATVYVGD